MEQPLAYRMKPKTLDDFFGQEQIVGENKLLYRLIKADRLSSAIFWGPPGCGKTSLARVIASTTKHKFVELNATNSGVADIKKIAEEAGEVLIASKNDENLVYESVDLIFHTLLLLVYKGIDLDNVFDEFERRRK